MIYVVLIVGPIFGYVCFKAGVNAICNRFDV